MVRLLSPRERYNMSVEHQQLYYYGCKNGTLLNPNLGNSLRSKRVYNNIVCVLTYFVSNMLQDLFKLGNKAIIYTIPV